MRPLVEELFSIIPGREKAVAIPVVEADSLSEKDFISKWVAKNRACLVKGAVKHWPAVQKFRLQDYWACIDKDCKVPVYAHMNHNVSGRKKMVGGKEMPFHEALDWLFSHKENIISIPVTGVNFEKYFSPVLKDMPGFSFLSSYKDPAGYSKRRLIIYRSAATAWHNHNLDETLMCQIKGTKRVMLLPPNMPRPDYVSEYLNKERHLDGLKLDESLNLNPMMIDVEEGDALYIPPYWYHGIIPVNNDIGFTLPFCWRSPIHVLGNFSNYFVRQIFKRYLWPASKRTIYVPFIAAYAGLAYMVKRMRGQA